MKRSGGGTPQISGWMQSSPDGVTWTTIEPSKATLPNLLIRPQSISGSAVIDLAVADQFRLVFDTDTPTTDTDFLAVSIDVVAKIA